MDETLPNLGDVNQQGGLSLPPTASTQSAGLGASHESNRLGSAVHSRKTVLVSANKRRSHRHNVPIDPAASVAPTARGSLSERLEGFIVSYVVLFPRAIFRFFELCRYYSLVLDAIPGEFDSNRVRLREVVRLLETVNLLRTVTGRSGDMVIIKQTCRIHLGLLEAYNFSLPAFYDCLLFYNGIIEKKLLIDQLKEFVDEINIEDCEDEKRKNMIKNIYSMAVLQQSNNPLWIETVSIGANKMLDTILNEMWKAELVEIVKVRLPYIKLKTFAEDPMAYRFMGFDEKHLAATGI